MCCSVLFASLLLPWLAAAVTTCSVLSYGGKADNSTDLGPAILSAWNNCVKPALTSVRTDTILLIPSGNFLLKSNVQMDKASTFNFKLEGNIYLPYDSSLTGNMIWFSHCDSILFSGSGKIYGNGYRYRPRGNLSLNPNRPRLLRFESCNNNIITGVTLYDAPKFHVTVIGDNNIVHDMAIHATNIGESKTSAPYIETVCLKFVPADGFDMSGNNNYVYNVVVENGDECVTVKTPTVGFKAENIVCIGTAGCNSGSYGSGATGVSIQNVYYRNEPNCQGTVKNLTYEDFTFTAAAYPLDIDSNWMGDGVDSGSLAISDVTFTNIKGTGTSSRPAVKLWCNKATPCKNIKFSGVSITGAAANEFTNACGTGLSGLPAC
ncbi:glycoside hydrolase family 28 protein [Atractiella rhizophila]|nr:glycoside hydrolase family 28 protein [Atractiella rhizophila]